MDFNFRKMILYIRRIVNSLRQPDDKFFSHVLTEFELRETCCLKKNNILF